MQLIKNQEILWEAYSATPKNLVSFLSYDQSKPFEYVTEMAMKLGHDQWDINQGDYKKLVQEVVDVFYDKEDFKPILELYVNFKQNGNGKLNGELEGELEDFSEPSNTYKRLIHHRNQEV